MKAFALKRISSRKVFETRRNRRAMAAAGNTIIRFIATPSIV
jgi:hypothetical protein